MSRTFRRKGLHRLCRKNTKVCHPDYAQVEWVEPFGAHCRGFTWRLPTKREAFIEFRRLHLADWQKPSPFYRKTMLRLERTNYKQQYRRWLDDPDFEIIDQQRIATNSRAW